MQQWAEIRRRVLIEGVSRRQILRETGMHRNTLKKILEHSEPPGYRQNQLRLDWSRASATLRASDDSQQFIARNSARIFRRNA